MRTVKVDTGKLQQVKEPKEGESYYLKDGKRVRLVKSLKSRDGKAVGYDLSATISTTERFVTQEALYVLPETPKAKEKK